MEFDLAAQGGIALCGVVGGSLGQATIPNANAAAMAACRLRTDSGLSLRQSHHPGRSQNSRRSCHTSRARFPHLSRLYARGFSSCASAEPCSGRVDELRSYSCRDRPRQWLFRPVTIHQGFLSFVWRPPWYLSEIDRQSSSTECCVLTRRPTPARAIPSAIMSTPSPATSVLKTARRKLGLLLLLGLLFASWASVLAQGTGTAEQSLVGIWGTEQLFGPMVRGTLTIDGRQAQWRASIDGFNVSVQRNGRDIIFSLPGNVGEFRGRINRDSTTVNGEWIQPIEFVNNNRYATPIRLVAVSASVWRGEVVPLDDRVSFYVSIQRQSDGSLKAAIVNPEHNLFRRRSYEVTLHDSKVTFKNPKRFDDRFDGAYEEASDRLSLALLASRPPLLLTRRNRDNALGFSARIPASAYTYTKPIAGNDGWPTATLVEVGIATEPIAALIQQIVAADPTDNPLRIDSLLVARHGKLVVG